MVVCRQICVSWDRQGYANRLCCSMIQLSWLQSAVITTSDCKIYNQNLRQYQFCVNRPDKRWNGVQYLKQPGNAGNFNEKLWANLMDKLCQVRHKTQFLCRPWFRWNSWSKNMTLIQPPLIQKPISQLIIFWVKRQRSQLRNCQT